ncbi:MAG: S-layer homology domain-containing protein [Armatimonadota bacterium]|nr:MAG: S-layer homology domain-containing protein [Armatimonadota bacterium]
MRASCHVGVLWSVVVGFLIAPAAALGMDLQPAGSSVGLPPYAVALEGDYAYCAADRLDGFDNNKHQAAFSALEIYDVRGTGDPQVVGVLGVDAIIGDLAVTAGHVYLASGDLRVVDVSDPAMPSEVRVISGAGTGICASGSYLYTADVDTGVHIFDISSPASPLEVGAFPTMAHAITVVGDLAYVAGGDKLLVLDVSNPELPAEIGRVATDTGSEISVSGGFAFLAREEGFTVDGGFTVIDVSDPTVPTIAAEYELSVPYGVSIHLAVWGSYAYLTAESCGITAVDISSPTNPTTAGSCSTAGHALGIAPAEGRAYVADYEGGLRVFDLLDPAAPREVGGSGAPAFVHSLTAANGRLFGASWHDYQMVVADISEPAAPRVTGGVCDGGDSFGSAVAVAGDYAYLGTIGASPGTLVYDLSGSGTLPALVGYVDVPGGLGDTYALVPKGDHVYAAVARRLVVLDVSNPAEPTVIGSLGVIEGQCDIALNEEGTHVFLASGVFGLRVVDVTDPEQPEEVVLVDTPVWAEAVEVSDNHAYVADGESLLVFDISDPTSPVLVAVWRCEDLDSVDLEIVGSYLYLADGAYGLRVIGISDPQHPVEVRNCALPDGPQTSGLGWYLGATGIAVSGGHVYVADYGWGVYVFELTSTFGDVPVDHWAADAVERCASNGIVSGYTERAYEPALAVSRDQMAVFISRSICSPTGEAGLADYNPPEAPSFSDVPPGHWAYKYVEYAAEHNVVEGYPDGSYAPQAALDRGQMAVFISRALAGDDASVPDHLGDPTFEDVPSDSWAYRHVEYIASEGLAGGYPDGLYHPERTCSRDQMAVFVTRAFELGM